MASGRIVAELGRPETPEETAARKARESRLYRERKTLSNLIYSLLATLVAVAAIVLAVPRPDTPIVRDIDAVAAARDAGTVLTTTPIVPQVDGTVNVAEIRTSPDGVISWNVGWVTPSKEFIGLTQAVNANPTWLSKQFADTAATGTTTVGGVDWTVYDNRTTGAEVGNARYAVTTEFSGRDGVTQRIVVFGTAPENELTAAIAAVAEQLRAAR